MWYSITCSAPGITAAAIVSPAAASADHSPRQLR
jgi:hypothetical protein